MLWFSSGLAAAYKLKLHGVNVTLYEAEERAGGKLRSVSQHGLVWDEGANTMVSYIIGGMGDLFTGSLKRCYASFEFLLTLMQL